MNLEFGDIRGICAECGSGDTKVSVGIGRGETGVSCCLCYRCYTTLRHEILSRDPQIASDHKASPASPASCSSR